MERETLEKSHQIHLGKVEFYYKTAQKYYEKWWYAKNLLESPENGALGLHYGFNVESTKNRFERILKENEVLARLANIKSTDLVLDAGCGVGGSAIWLSKNIGSRVIPLNVVDMQLRRGQELTKKYNVADKIIFTEADYHYQPFSDNSFDVFWSLESMEHSDNLEKFLGGAYRVLKPGGRLIIAATFKGDVKPDKRQEHQLAVGARCAGAFNDFRKASEVLALLGQVGFTSLENKDVTPWVTKSAKEMKRACRGGLLGAMMLNKLGIVTDVMVDNTRWGIYQEGLFKKRITSYNVLIGRKN